METTQAGTQVPDTPYRPFGKVLVANRGEIAVRILRACRERGLATVAVYSDADREACHVRLADEAVHIGAAPSQDSYLNQAALLQAAARTGADAVHPGYGFLAENPDFAAACLAAGLVWIGPQPEVIRQMGSKTEARRLAQAEGIPVVPGYEGADDDLGSEAEKLGYPVLLKAVAGGGGRGMRMVERAGQLPAALASARREAGQAFGDERLYLEKYLSRVRHIEFQILGDARGQLIHLFERECSLQRRYQKLIEESPSPSLSPALRARMGEAAVKLGRALGYCGAGTVEFVLDADSERFYFLEVNARLQVEHPVTELVTGVDLVHWQLRIAAGEPLSLEQDTLRQQGHAIECRLCAEDPSRDFMPGTGVVLAYAEAPGARTDSGITTGQRVPVDYDSMLAKLIVHGESRSVAIQQARTALERTVILGLRSNLSFLDRLIGHPAFASADFHTRWIEQQLAADPAALLPPTPSLLQRHELAIVATLWARHRREQARSAWRSVPAGWRNSAGTGQEARLELAGETIRVFYSQGPDHALALQIDDTRYLVRLAAAGSDEIGIEIDGLRRSYRVAAEDDSLWIHHPALGSEKVTFSPRFPQAGADTDHEGYLATMPAKILQILVEQGQAVEAGQPLIVLESMKMESTLCAAEPGIIGEIFVSAGERVEAGVTLLSLTTTGSTEQVPDAMASSGTSTSTATTGEAALENA